MRTFLDSAPVAGRGNHRDWLAGIATVMVASAFAEGVIFYGLVVEGRLAAWLFWSVLLVLYALIGLVLLLILHAIFPDDWDSYLFVGSGYLLALLILLAWPAAVPVAIVRGLGGVREPAESPQLEPAEQKMVA